MSFRNARDNAIEALETRLGRRLSSTDMIQLAALAYALKLRRAQQRRTFRPRMELVDDGDSPRVAAVFEVPGLRPENVSVYVVDGRLVVSGERRRYLSDERTVVQPSGARTTLAVSDSSSVQAGVPQISELKYGLIRRVVDLPPGCTTADLRTSMENGMLTVSWPRHPLDGPICKIEPESSTDVLDVPTSTVPRFGGGSSSRAM